MKYDLLKNGQCYTRTGTKVIAVDRQYNLRPVLYAIYSGYTPDRGTIQGIKIGDILLKCTWDSSDVKFRIYKHGVKEEISFNEQAEIWHEVKEKHSWLDKWLEPSPREGTWIPKDIVPEEEYLYKKRKKEKIKQFIQKYGIPYEDSIFLYDNKQDLKLTPRVLEMNLDTILPIEKYWDGSMVNIFQYERWYGSDGDGISHQLTIDPEYEEGSNYAYTKTISRPGNPGIGQWRKFKYVIRIKFGIYTRDHYSYGHSIDVWKTE